MKDWLTIALLILLGTTGALATGDCLQARRLFNQSISAPTPAAEIRLLEEAARRCRDPEVLGPVYNNLADAHGRLGHQALAFFYYRQAVRVKPDLGIAYVGAADLYAAIGDAYSAYILYHKAQRYGYPEERLRERRERAAQTWPRDLVVYFPKNQAALTPPARERLDLLVAKCQQEASGLSFIIEGFTCDLGPPGYNKSLARRRAQAVDRYLREQLGPRVLASAITAHGADHRAVPEDHETARILNRRVRLRVLAGQALSGPTFFESNCASD